MTKLQIAAKLLEIEGNCMLMRSSILLEDYQIATEKLIKIKTITNEILTSCLTKDEIFFYLAE